MRTTSIRGILVIVLAVIASLSLAHAQTYSTRGQFGFAAQAKEEDGRVFDACRDDAIAAFDVGRLYHLSKRSMRKSLLETSEPRAQTAESVMDEMDRNPTEHYATIAARRFASCAKTRGSSDPAQFKVEEICMAQLDIPTTLIAFREEGLPEQQAIEKTQRFLSSPSVYPAGLVQGLAKLVYERRSSGDDWATRRIVYLKCMERAAQAAQ